MIFSIESGFSKKDILLTKTDFISILACHLLHGIEERLRQKDDKRSWITIKEILQTHQMVTVVLPDGDKNTYII